LTPPPTSPNTPIPKVGFESSLRRKETPVARFEATPLSLRATPYRFVGGNTPSIDPARRLEVMWKLGISN
jgi:hypothetical protein